MPPPPSGVPPLPPRQSDILQSQLSYHGDDMSAMSSGTCGASGSIAGGRNEQANLRSQNPNGRNVSNVITKRVIARTAKKMPEPEPNTYADNKVDTNADTCCLGQNFVPLAYTNRSADVYPYNDAYDPIENVPKVSTATAYNHEDGNTYILVFHESLYYGKKMRHSLINPNQVRFNGLDFFDNPARDEEFGTK